jgi:Domain of unknown function (DUF4407)
MTEEIASFLAWLGGGDRETLSKVPGERRGFAQQAIMLLGTACIIGAAMFFALREITGVPAVAAALLAIFWGIFNLNIDRFAVISIRRSRRRKTQLLLCVFPILLTALTTAVVTEPLALRVYASEVAAQISTAHSGSGFLAQVDALSQLGQREAVVAWSAPVIGALYFTVSVLPFAVAIISTLGPPSIYEVLMKNEEDMLADQVKLDRVTRRKDAEREADRRIAVNEDMRLREEDLGKRANAHIALTMSAFLDTALQDWQEKVQEALSLPDTGSISSGPQPAAGQPPLKTAAGEPPPQRAIWRYELPEDDSELL